MSRPARRACALLAVCMGFAVTAPARVAAASAQWVLPGGQEPLFLRAFREAAAAARCRLSGVAIADERAVATLVCGDETVHARVHHPDQAPEDAVRAGKVALSFDAGAPAPVRRAIQRAVSVTLAGVRWIRVDERPPSLRRSTGPSGAPADVTATAPTAPLVERFDVGPDGKPVPPDVVAAYRRGLSLYRAGKHRAALDVFLGLARKQPRYGGVLGLVVANLAPLQPDTARVEALARDADAHPDDPLRQFLAGVAAHYNAHYRARTPEEKVAMYRRCIEYLERCREAYAFEPRVYIYLAVSHYRLGEQAQAEKLIDEAARLSAEDPDVYYCRAEIYHRKDPKRALADLDRYLSMIERHRARGGIVPARKVERVALLRRYVQAIADGKGPDDDLFDPLQPADAPPVAAALGGDGTRPWLVVIVLGVAIVVAAASAWRRAHRRA